MRNFVLGLATAAAMVAVLFAAGYVQVPQDPCKACAPGTRCTGRLCVAEGPAPAAPAPKKRQRRVQAQTPGAPPAGEAAGEEEPARPAIVLKPGDLKPVSSGDNLTGTEVIDLSKDGEAGDHELTQEELDAVFQKRQGDILSCLEQARGEALVTGRLTVSFRVQRAGTVSGVRVEAPAYLMAHGLYACIRPIVSGLRFPRSSRGQVVSYPFALR